MKKLTTLSLLATVTLFSQSSFARNTRVDIDNFELWSSINGSDGIRVIVTTAISNPSNCTDPDSYMVNASLSDKVKDRIYSTLLSSVMANKPVTIVVDGCQDSRPAINTVIIK